MTNSEDKPPPAVGAYWIKEEDYPALLQLFDDGDKMPPNWQEWLKMAEEMELGLAEEKKNRALMLSVSVLIEPT